MITLERCKRKEPEAGCKIIHITEFVFWSFSLEWWKQVQLLAPEPVLRKQLEEVEVKIMITLERCKRVQF